MNWYLKVLKQYSDFNGRARRKEYWVFVLFNALFSSVLSFINFNTLLGVYTLVIFLPNIAVTVRRLHDTGKSGWMYFIILIPVIGWIWFFILLVKEGDKGENEYGSDPKAEEGIMT